MTPASIMTRGTRDGMASDNVRRERFEFTVDGDAIAGMLFLPQQHTPRAALVTTGPTTSVKEQASGAYADLRDGTGGASPQS
jgi:hypothetical protein